MGKGKRPALDDAAATLLSLSASPKRLCTEPPLSSHGDEASSSERGSPSRDTICLPNPMLPEAALELYTLLQEDQRAADRSPPPQKSMGVATWLLTRASCNDPSPQSPAEPIPAGDCWDDVEVLTSASVLLAACGVQHALQLADDSSLSPQICAILRSECLHVRSLDGPKIARLCHLLKLAPSVGATWQTRVDRLCDHLTQYLAKPLGASRVTPTCAAAARSAFHTAVPQALKPGSHIGRFGHQTVWCIVTMLRRIEREAGFNSQHTLPSCHAALQLASVAVSVISGSMANMLPRGHSMMA